MAQAIATGTAAAPSRRAAATVRVARPYRRRNTLAGYMFLAPWLGGLLLLTLGPTLASFYLSFTRFDLLTPPRWIGIDNFVRMFTTDLRYWNALGVTFTYVVLAVPFKLAVALGIALILNRGLAGLPLYRALFYLPSLLGGSVAIAMLWRQLFYSDGVVNKVLAVFGVTGPSWISDPRTSLYTLVILAVWQFGSPMIIFLAGLRQIPKEYYDAAAVDGAGPLHRFRHITLPLLAPIVFFNLVLQTIDAFKAFTPAFIVSGGQGGPVDSTLFYTLYLYQEGFSYFRMGYAAAMAWVLLVLIAVFTAITFLTQKYWVHYEDGGADRR